MCQLVRFVCPGRVTEHLACNDAVQATGGRREIDTHEALAAICAITMAHPPLKMSVDEAHSEVRIGWEKSYSPKAIEAAVDSLNHKPLSYRMNIFLARLVFRRL